MNKYIVYTPNGDVKFLKANGIKDILYSMGIYFYSSLYDGYGFVAYGVDGKYVIRNASKTMLHYYGM